MDVGLRKQHQPFPQFFITSEASVLTEPTAKRLQTEKHYFHFPFPLFQFLHLHMVNNIGCYKAVIQKHMPLFTECRKKHSFTLKVYMGLFGLIEGESKFF